MNIWKPLPGTSEIQTEPFLLKIIKKPFRGYTSPNCIMPFSILFPFAIMICFIKITIASLIITFIKSLVVSMLLGPILGIIAMYLDPVFNNYFNDLLGWEQQVGFWKTAWEPYWKNKYTGKTWPL